MRHMLIANRAAIAVRAARTCRAMGIETTALTALTDTQDTHARWADHQVAVEGWGMPDTYDSAERVLDAVERSGADSVYPGYGSLAENAGFVAELEARGVTFVGPSSDALRLAGSKAAAIDVAHRVGVPVLPHASGRGRHKVLGHVRRVGTPVVLKPEFGYGGQQVRVAHSQAEVEEIVASAPEDTPWYVERYVPDAQVIGVSLAVDGAGTVVELGERESLLLADGLKLLEASPVAGVGAEALEAMRADAARVAASIGLRNVMTVEFIAGSGAYYFLEVNGRLPLAYQMSEEQCATDLIELQLRIARGETIGRDEVSADQSRHCLEARLFVHPDELGDFPAVGALSRLDLAETDGVAYTCSVDPARPVTYELILAQALAAGEDRAAVARRVRRAIDASSVDGLRCYAKEIGDRLSEMSGPAPGRTR